MRRLALTGSGYFLASNNVETYVIRYDNGDAPWARSYSKSLRCAQVVAALPDDSTAIPPPPMCAMIPSFISALISSQRHDFIVAEELKSPRTALK
jgi:hypothetical protein